jgi:hypothetical protein
VQVGRQQLDVRPEEHRIKTTRRASFLLVQKTVDKGMGTVAGKDMGISGLAMQRTDTGESHSNSF